MTTPFSSVSRLAGSVSSELTFVSSQAECLDCHKIYSDPCLIIRIDYSNKLHTITLCTSAAPCEITMLFILLHFPQLFLDGDTPIPMCRRESVAT